MNGTNLWNDEQSSIRICEWASEDFIEGNLLELKYIIKDGDKPWTEVSSIEWKFHGI